MKNKAINHISIDAVAESLQEMVDNDKNALKKNPIDNDEIKKVMDFNRKKVRRIIKQHGLISISKFGEKASFNAWLLIQHFPKTSIKFMEKYLEMMKVSKKDINLRNLAYLQDRVNVYKGMPQIYGTQLYGKNGSKTRKFRPILNVLKVDELRKKQNIESLSEYIEIFKQTGDFEVEIPEGYKV